MLLVREGIRRFHYILRCARRCKHSVRTGELKPDYHDEPGGRTAQLLGLERGIPREARTCRQILALYATYTSHNGTRNKGDLGGG